MQAHYLGPMLHSYSSSSSWQRTGAANANGRALLSSGANTVRITYARSSTPGPGRYVAMRNGQVVASGLLRDLVEGLGAAGIEETALPSSDDFGWLLWGNG